MIFGKRNEKPHPISLASTTRHFVAVEELDRWGIPRSIYSEISEARYVWRGAGLPPYAPSLLKSHETPLPLNMSPTPRPLP